MAKKKLTKRRSSQVVPVDEEPHLPMFLMEIRDQHDFTASSQHLRLHIRKSRNRPNVWLLSCNALNYNWIEFRALGPKDAYKKALLLASKRAAWLMKCWKKEIVTLTEQTKTLTEELHLR